MADQGTDTLTIRIGNKLRGLSLTSAECSILKVPEEVRYVNQKAYEPRMLAIGPYHHNKGQLKAMEHHKLQYLATLLQRREETNVERYVMAMKEVAEQAEKCYGDSTDLGQDDFVEMMVLDGCFVIELLRKLRMKNLRDANDPIFKAHWIVSRLRRDMLLVENQLPFFVLQRLFDMTVMPYEQNNFIPMISWSFKSILPGPGCLRSHNYPTQEIKHLLGFVHDNWLASPAGIEAYNQNMARKKTWRFIRCATELKEAGIKFRKVKGEVRSLFDINFENGIMEIPTIRVDDDTESIFRNLIAYEQFSYSNNLNHVVDFITFMGSLISSSDDVKLLCGRGIIDNWLGDDEAIAILFNRLGQSVILSSANYYAEIFNKVNLHCNWGWNRWMASLRHNYFNSPWSLISFTAGVFLLLLAFMQTWYTVRSFYHKA